MKRLLLGSVAFAALLSAGQITNAQAPSNPTAAAERPASEPAEKKSPPPKAQNESKEAPGANLRDLLTDQANTSQHAAHMELRNETAAIQALVAAPAGDVARHRPRA